MTVNPQGVQDPTAGTQFVRALTMFPLECDATCTDTDDQPGSKTVEISSPADAGKRDVVEGAPGVIESAELAPLGEGKVSSVNGELDAVGVTLRRLMG